MIDTPTYTLADRRKSKQVSRVEFLIVDISYLHLKVLWSVVKSSLKIKSWLPGSGHVNTAHIFEALHSRADGGLQLDDPDPALKGLRVHNDLHVEGVVHHQPFDGLLQKDNKHS